MTEPVEPVKKPLNPAIAYGGLAVGVIALIVGSITTAKKTPVAKPVAVVEQPAVELTPNDVVVKQEVAKDLPLDRNTVCDLECKKLKYTIGRWGLNACHCLNEY